MTRLDRETAAECSYLASYINDDGTIANYLGIGREHVVRIRAQRRRTTQLGRPTSDRLDLEPSLGTGAESTLSYKLDAIRGSQRLLEAVLRAVANGATQVRP